ncbi:MAG: ParB/RepB/Spo0J family partition protein [Clostridia bacterium]|nr:ParB/RepB/Spo0J family partition protein [Clostridia bacterium]
MAKKNSLGRGLDSLFLENDEPGSNTVSVLRVSEIEPNPTQPRKHFDTEALQSLADSIARHGLLQPIAVREHESGFYRIIAGERRWRAAKMAGLIEIPAIIYEMDDKKAAELALIENLQREDLNPIEEAAAFRALIQDFDMTQEEMSQQIGKSRSAIANAMRLLDLPSPILSLVAEGTLSAGHARAILSLDREEDMHTLAAKIIERTLSVRETEAQAKLLNAQAAQQAMGLTEEEAPDKTAIMTQSYLRSLERRVSSTLGRRFRIIDGGKGKAKRIELTYEGNEDLEVILKRLCGEDFFEQTDL